MPSPALSQLDPNARNASLDALRQLVANELAEPVRAEVSWLADQIRRDFGDAVVGVLFYGSCLRKESNEGVLDFWIVVEDYDAAYGEDDLASRVRARLNRIAPPNVFYYEGAYPGGAAAEATRADGDADADQPGGTAVAADPIAVQPETLRTKFGVIDRRDFERNTSLAARHPYVWARFAQPARLLACRDAAARSFLVACVSEAIITMVGRLVCFLPIRAGQIRFRVAAFWQLAFRLTYDSERRPESDDSIRGLYLADETRYDEVGSLAVTILAERGHFDSAVSHPRAVDIALSARKRGWQRLRWRLMRPYARAIGLVRLIKTTWTFGDWVPYALWKLERHTGRALDVSERQRKHPFLFGWPVILPLLFKRNLR